MATDTSTTNANSSDTGESSTGSMGSSGTQTAKSGEDFHHHDGDHVLITPGSLTGGQLKMAYDMHFIPPSTPVTPPDSSTTSTTSSSSSSASTNTTSPSWMSDAGYTNHDGTVPSPTGTSATSGQDGPVCGNWTDYHTANTGSMTPIPHS